MTDTLPELLATLLPGDTDWPSGDTIAAFLSADAAPAFATILAQLPPGFVRGDEATLRAIEAACPEAFERVVTESYLAYYTDPAVRGVIERLTGYEARPPQPHGYALPPFDETVLAVQKQRAPFWRDPDAEAPANAGSGADPTGV
jgi:hypothetical protein